MPTQPNIPYTAWLHWSPTEECNLQCSYCLSAKNRIYTKKTWLFPKRTAAINIKLFLRTLERSGKTFKISFVGGGEPFLVPNLAKLCGVLSKKHFLSFNTNLTSKQIPELVNLVPPSRILDIGASLHIDELTKRNLLDNFISNYLLCKTKGFNISAREIAHPSMKQRVSELKSFFIKKGIILNFDPFIGTYQNKLYPAAYTEEELNIFDLQRIKDQTQRNDIHRQSQPLCNAGYNVAYVHPSGDIWQCPAIPKKIGHVYNEVTFQNELSECTAKFCVCPLNKYDQALFELAKNSCAL